jgi:ribokinase
MGSGVDVIGFGAMNLDEIAVVPRIVVDGETRIRELRRRPGGSAANTVYALAKLGMATAYVGAVGDDPAGQILVQDLTKAGVDTSQVVVKAGEPTGFVWAIADASKRSLYVYPGANDLLHWRDVHLTSMARVRLVHLTSFVNPKQLALQVWAVRRMPSSVKVSFAPGALYAARGASALRPILERTAVLFANGTEAGMLTRRKDVRAAAEVLLRLGCGIVVITLGAGAEIGRAESREPSHGEGPRRSPGRRGGEAGMGPRIKGGAGGREPRSVRAACYVTDGQAVEILPLIARGRRAVDSVGAGDAFAAGFLFGLLRDRPPGECARIGQTVALRSVQGPGARDTLPNLLQLRQDYRRHFGSCPW